MEMSHITLESKVFDSTKTLLRAITLKNLCGETQLLPKQRTMTNVPTYKESDFQCVSTSSYYKQ